MSLTSFSASGYTVHSMIDRYANGGITMAYSQPIADVLREFFVLSNIDAGFEEQAGCGVFTFRTKLHCRMQTAQMTVLVREDNFSTLTAIPLAADKNSRLAVAEYLTRVNFNMRNGNFELNMEVFNPDVHDQITAHIDRAIITGREITRDYLAALSLPVKLRNAACWIFSPYL